MDGAAGMVAVVRGLQDAGLAVTLCDNGKQFTLAPSSFCAPRFPIGQSSNFEDAPQMSSSPAYMQHARGSYAGNYGGDMMRRGSMFPNVRSTATDVTTDRINMISNNASTQVVDGRYASVYQTTVGKMKPTSPTVELPEFPLQRPLPDVCRDSHAHSNFVIGGAESGDRSCSPVRVFDSYRGRVVWSDRGSVVPRQSREPDAFVKSLRKYPRLSPDRSTEIVERLINYTQAKNYGKSSSRNSSRLVDNSEQTEERKARSPSRNMSRGCESPRPKFNDESPTRDKPRKLPELDPQEYRRPFSKSFDVRHLEDMTKMVREMRESVNAHNDYYSNPHHYQTCAAHRERSERSPDRKFTSQKQTPSMVHSQIQATVAMVCREVTTVPRPEPQKRSVTVSSFSEADRDHKGRVYFPTHKSVQTVDFKILATTTSTLTIPSDRLNVNSRKSRSFEEIKNKNNLHKTLIPNVKQALFEGDLPLLKEEIDLNSIEKEIENSSKRILWFRNYSIKRNLSKNCRAVQRKMSKACIKCFESRFDIFRANVIPYIFSNDHLKNIVRAWLNSIPLKSYDLMGRLVKKEQIICNVIRRLKMIPSRVKLDRKKFRAEILDIVDDVPFDFSNTSKSLYVKRIVEDLIHRLENVKTGNFDLMKQKRSFCKNKYTVNTAAATHVKRATRTLEDEIRYFVKSELIESIQKSQLDINASRIKNVENELVELLLECLEDIKQGNEREVTDEIVAVLEDIGQLLIFQAMNFTNTLLTNFKDRFRYILTDDQSSSEYVGPILEEGSITNLEKSCGTGKLELDVSNKCCETSFAKVTDSLFNFRNTDRCLDPVIKANIKRYTNELSNKIEEWLNTIQSEAPQELNRTYKEIIIQKLANEIVDRQKYLQLNPGGRTSEKDELENMRYQIFKWIDKFEGDSSIETLKNMPTLMQMIRSLPVPLLTRRRRGWARHDCSIFTYKIPSDIEVNSKTGVTVMSTHQLSAGSCAGGNLNDLARRTIAQNIVKTGHEDQPDAVFTNTRKPIGPKGTTILTVQDTVGRTAADIKKPNEVAGPSGKSGPNYLAPKPSVGELNQEFDQFVKQWVQSVPFPAETMQDKELCDKMREGLYHGVWKAIAKIKSSPAIISNPCYYEDVLDDEIKELFSLLPPSEELTKNEHRLKVQLIEKTSNLNEKIKLSIAPETFAQQVRNNVTIYIPETETNIRGEDEVRLYEELKILFLADEYLLFLRYKDEDEVKANVYRIKLLRRVEEFVKDLKHIHKQELKDIDEKNYMENILAAIEQVPLPSSDTIKQEADEVLLGIEIDKWFSDLPLNPNDNVMEQLKRRRLRDNLAKKLYDLEKSVAFDDNTKDMEFKHEISLILEKLPLGKDETLNINFMVDELTNRIKNRQKAPTGRRKSVVFNDVADNNNMKCCGTSYSGQTPERQNPNLPGIPPTTQQVTGSMYQGLAVPGPSMPLQSTMQTGAMYRPVYQPTVTTSVDQYGQVYPLLSEGQRLSLADPTHSKQSTVMRPTGQYPAIQQQMQLIPENQVPDCCNSRANQPNVPLTGLPLDTSADDPNQSLWLSEHLQKYEAAHPPGYQRLTDPVHFGPQQRDMVLDVSQFEEGQQQPVASSTFHGPRAPQMSQTSRSPTQHVPANTFEHRRGSITQPTEKKDSEPFHQHKASQNGQVSSSPTQHPPTKTFDRKQSISRANQPNGPTTGLPLDTSADDPNQSLWLSEHLQKYEAAHPPGYQRLTDPVHFGPQQRDMVLDASQFEQGQQQPVASSTFHEPRAPQMSQTSRSPTQHVPANTFEHRRGSITQPTEKKDSEPFHQHKASQNGQVSSSPTQHPPTKTFERKQSISKKTQSTDKKDDEVWPYTLSHITDPTISRRPVPPDIAADITSHKTQPNTSKHESSKTQKDSEKNISPSTEHDTKYKTLDTHDVSGWGTLPPVQPRVDVPPHLHAFLGPPPPEKSKCPGIKAGQPGTTSTQPNKCNMPKCTIKDCGNSVSGNDTHYQTIHSSNPPADWGASIQQAQPRDIYVPPHLHAFLDPPPPPSSPASPPQNLPMSAIPQGIANAQQKNGIYATQANRPQDSVRQDDSSIHSSKYRTLETSNLPEEWGKSPPPAPPKYRREDLPPHLRGFLDRPPTPPPPIILQLPPDLSVTQPGVEPVMLRPPTDHSSTQPGVATNQNAPAQQSLGHQYTSPQNKPMPAAWNHQPAPPMIGQYPGQLVQPPQQFPADQTMKDLSAQEATGSLWLHKYMHDYETAHPRSNAPLQFGPPSNNTAVQDPTEYDSFGQGRPISSSLREPQINQSPQGFQGNHQNMSHSEVLGGINAANTAQGAYQSTRQEPQPKHFTSQFAGPFPVASATQQTPKFYRSTDREGIQKFIDQNKTRSASPRIENGQQHPSMSQPRTMAPQSLQQSEMSGMQQPGSMAPQILQQSMGAGMSNYGVMAPQSLQQSGMGHMQQAGSMALQNVQQSGMSGMPYGAMASQSLQQSRMVGLPQPEPVVSQKLQQSGMAGMPYYGYTTNQTLNQSRTQQPGSMAPQDLHQSATVGVPQSGMARTHQVPSTYQQQYPGSFQMSGVQQTPGQQQIASTSYIQPGAQQIPRMQQTSGFQQIPRMQQTSEIQQIAGFQTTSANTISPTAAQQTGGTYQTPSQPVGFSTPAQDPQRTDAPPKSCRDAQTNAKILPTPDLRQESFEEFVQTNISFENPAKDFSIQTAFSTVEITTLKKENSKPIRKTKSQQIITDKYFFVRDDIYEWLYDIYNAYKSKIWSSKLEQLAEKIKEPGEEEKLRSKIKAYLKKVPSHFDDDDVDGRNFRERLPDYIIGKLKKLNSKREKKSKQHHTFCYDLQNAHEFRKNSNHNRLRSLIKAWIRSLPIKKKDFLCRSVSREQILHSILQRLQPLISHGPENQSDYERLLKSYITEIASELPIEDNMNKQKTYLESIVNELVDKIMMLNVDTRSRSLIISGSVDNLCENKDSAPVVKDLEKFVSEEMTRLLTDFDVVVERSDLENKIVFILLKTLQTPGVYVDEDIKLNINDLLQQVGGLPELRSIFIGDELIKNFKYTFLTKMHKSRKRFGNAYSEACLVYYSPQTNIKEPKRHSDNTIDGNAKAYTKLITAHINQWLSRYKNNLPMVQHQTFRDMAVNELVETLINRHKYLKLHPTYTSDMDDYEHWKCLIYKWIQKIFGEDNIEIIQHVPELLNKLQKLPVPAFSCEAKAEGSFIKPLLLSDRLEHIVKDLYEEIFDWFYEFPSSLHEMKNRKVKKFVIKKLAENIAKSMKNGKYPEDFIDKEVDAWAKKFLKNVPRSLLLEDLKIRLKNLAFERQQKQNDASLQSVIITNNAETKTDFTVKAAEYIASQGEAAKEVSEEINKWLTQLALPINDEVAKETAIINLAADITDRNKYLQLNPPLRVSDSNELETLKYQIFKWLNKVVSEDNLETIAHASELMQRLRDIAPKTKLKNACVGNNRFSYVGESIDSLRDKCSQTISVEMSNSEIETPQQSPVKSIKFNPKKNSASTNVDTFSNELSYGAGSQGRGFTEKHGRLVCSKINNPSSMCRYLRESFDSFESSHMPADEWYYPSCSQEVTIDQTSRDPKQCTYSNCYSDNYITNSMSSPQRPYGRNKIYKDTGTAADHVSTEVYSLSISERSAKLDVHRDNISSGFGRKAMKLPFRIDETIPTGMTLAQTYEYFDHIFRKRCNELPVNDSTPERKISGELARKGVHSALWKTYFRLKSDSSIESDYKLFEALFEDQLDLLLECIPQTQEIKGFKAGWKTKILIDVMRMLKYVHSITDVFSFRQKLADKIERHFLQQYNQQLSDRNQYVFTVNTVDTYVLFRRYKTDDPMIANIYRQRLMKRLEELVEYVKTSQNVDFREVNRNYLCQEAFKLLGSVPLPDDETLKDEADEILLCDEIEQWYTELPVAPLQSDLDNLLRQRTREILAKKLYAIEKKYETDHPEIANKEIIQEVIQFLQKHTCLSSMQDFNFAAQDLANRLKHRRQRVLNDNTLESQATNFQVAYPATVMPATVSQHYFSSYHESVSKTFDFETSHINSLNVSQKNTFSPTHNDESKETNITHSKYCNQIRNGRNVNNIRPKSPKVKSRKSRGVGLSQDGLPSKQSGSVPEGKTKTAAFRTERIVAASTCSHGGIEPGRSYSEIFKNRKRRVFYDDWHRPMMYPYIMPWWGRPF